MVDHFLIPSTHSGQALAEDDDFFNGPTEKLGTILSGFSDMKTSSQPKSPLKKAIYAALIGNSMIAVTKFAAATHTGSSAMMSEGIHSLVDTGNQVLLLYGIKRAKIPASPSFPFGHGKEIYFWSFVVEC